ncbi:hypothetical protein [Brevibacillus dissolubilis]|uniref:hypothetical protein n=1 Tax=Brevibacillus dissolubilis TaxID=1844116 RepID=UPI001117A340|nr:hypothetical protein [Brevibacillus dissolubilis]
MYRQNKIGFTLFLIFALMALLVAGCGDQRSAKQVLFDTYKEQLNIKSYSFDGSLKMRADAKGADVEADPQAKMVLDALKKSELKYRGTVSLEPFQIEMILDASIDLQGMTTNFNMPIVMNQDKMWVKIPALPFLAETQQLQGKFVELDYKELAKSTGEEPIDMASQLKAQRQLIIKASDSLSKNLEDTYFIDLKKEEFKLPEGVEAERIVKMYVTNETYLPFLKTLAAKVAPELIDAMLADKELQKAYAMTEEELKEGKTNLADLVKDFDKDAAELKSVMDLKKLDMILAVDKANHLPYTLVDLDVTVKPEGEDMTVDFGITVDQKTTNINAEPKWEIGIPKAGEVIPYTEMMQMMGSM